MPNMSHCRMENTYNDLRDCWKNWCDISSETEKKYRAKILTICREIVTDFGDEAEET